MQNTENLIKLFEQYIGCPPHYIEQLPESGSNRRYYRLVGIPKNDEQKEISLIGAFSENKAESTTFVAMTKHFKTKGLPVPTLYITNEDSSCYLQQDLGNTSLLALVEQKTQNGPWLSSLTDIYKKTIKQLLNFQINALQDLDEQFLGQPLGHFDAQLAIWDCHYFKYCFLKPLQINFDEAALEKDFQCLANYLATFEGNYFLLRDCQARNIMLVDNMPYFIDYQGGMRGPLAYDLASLLYQAKAAIPQNIRRELLEYYIDCLCHQQPNVDKETFRQQFYAFVLIRTLQVLGAYGFRGLFERKKHFIESIPFALNNVGQLLQLIQLPINLPELFKVLQQLSKLNFEAQKWHTIMEKKPEATPIVLPELPQNFAEQLTVIVQSFSYKRGLPTDSTGHGNGFVFDCRSLHNPGRYEPYKALTGKDKAVQNFLEEKSHVSQFLQHIYGIIDEAVKVYSERKLAFMTINFGCTGGQHRSVYCAEKLTEYLKTHFTTTAVKVTLQHVEQELRAGK